MNDSAITTTPTAGELGRRPRVVSGITPSGTLTLGNYLGAMQHWVDLQDSHDCTFTLVDQHALTVPQDPAALGRRCMDFVALYLAAGVDPARSTVFIQSHVPGHTELAWYLSCQATVGELNRMTQFKERSAERGGGVSAGLFTYPVLMAADILLYDADRVPVGADQKQHLEICRDLAQRFNARFGQTFVEPEPLVPEVGARIMSLQDPTRKMSKSDPVDANRIGLLDKPDVIARKIRRAVTDSDGEIRADPERPGVTNLLNMLSSLTGTSIDALACGYRGKGYGALKEDLVEATTERLLPIQQRFQEIRSETGELDRLLRAGANRAAGRALGTLRRTRAALGLVAG